MAIYFGFVACVLSVMGLYEITRKKYWYVIATIFMSIFAGIRYRVGTDYMTYEGMFESAKNQQYIGYEGDIGFLFVSKLISHFTENIRWNFFVISSCITVMFMIYIYKNSKFKFLSVALYLMLGGYFTAFNIMRQYIAIGIILFAINYIGTNKNIRYYTLVIIASLFHTTAIIMMPIKLLIERDWTKKVYCILLAITIIILPNVNIIINLMGEESRIGGYGDSYYTNVGSNPIGFLVYVGIYYFCYMYMKKRNIEKQSKYIKLMFIGILFSLLSLKGLIFSRIAAYFNVAILIQVPEVWRNIKKDERAIILYFIILCLAIYLYVSLLTQGHLLPYRIN